MTPHAAARLLLPAGVDAAVAPLLIGRALRGFADGFVAVLLPSYLLALGLDPFDVGVLSTATLAGSALATVAIGVIGHRWPSRSLLRAAAVVMALTGVAFAGLSAFWPLLMVAFVGTLNPSSGDVSVFLPLEHARLAQAARADARTALFARYSLTGSLSAAVGALAAAVPPWLAANAGLPLLSGLRAMFLLYAFIGAAVWWLYRALPQAGAQAAETPAAPLGPSRGIVFRLAALFSVDAFAGGLVVNSLMSLWLFQRFGLSLTQAGAFFFWTGLLAAGSQLAAPVVARRIGLLNTMVFTHIPANVCLILAALSSSLPVALALLFVRSALSQMDVPTRTAFVMAVVTPAERAAAASFTAVPRSLASAASPTLAGALLAAGWLSAPLVACGALKIAYDLALLLAFRQQQPPADAG
jgi:MFS family permease